MGCPWSPAPGASIAQRLALVPGRRAARPAAGAFRHRPAGRVARVGRGRVTSRQMAVRTARSRAGNLPSELTSFVGRRHELAEIKRLLTTTRLLTLTGSGGAGKTRL